MSVNLCFSKDEAFFLHTIMRSIDPGKGNPKATEFVRSTLDWLRNWYGAPYDDDVISGVVRFDRTVDQTAELATRNWAFEEGFHQAVVMRKGEPVAVFHNEKDIAGLFSPDVTFRRVRYYADKDDWEREHKKKREAALAKLTAEDREALGLEAA